MSDQTDASTGSRRKGRGRFDMDAWWQDRSTPQKVLWGIGFGFLGIGLLALLGFVVMTLWNWLAPDIFGLKRLDYWQAAGLFVLCAILFKGFRLGSDTSSRSADRRRREHLRSYMQEGEAPAGGETGGEA